MRTKLLAVFSITLFVAILLFSCNKTETINELTLPSSEKVTVTSSANCDYSEAYATNITSPDPDTTAFTNIFSKTYEAGTNRIKNIKTVLIDVFYSAIISDYQRQDISVTYRGYDIICFSKTENDTLAIITLDSITQRPIRAIARAEWDIPESKTVFQFIYSSGHLIQIRWRDWFLHPDDRYLRPFITLKYQDDYRNLYKVFYGNVNSPNRMVFTYDKRKTYTGQYYPDQFSLAYYDFWSFLKQLDLFPELLPKFRLTEMRINAAENPGDDITTYSNQQADASGKLVSYDVTHSHDGSTYTSFNHYKVNWQCSVSQNLKQPYNINN